jgi:hypothetical protein
MTLHDLTQAMLAVTERMEAEAAAEVAALAAVDWPRWRCRFGWHRPVAGRSGDVTHVGFVTRYECASGCGAWWLEDALGRDRQR